MTDEPEGRLRGRRAIVVGGGGGIGGAIARRFHAEGASVAVVDVNEGKALDVAEALHGAPGGKVMSLCTDIGSPENAKAAVETIATALGGLDITVHCAAAREPTATVEEADPADWDEAVRVNLTSMFLLCKYAIPHLRAAGGGVVINIASQLGSVVTVGRPAYHATKGAVIQLTKAIAVECAKDNIRAVSISPGAIETDRLLVRHADFDQVRERLVPLHPIGRLGQPDEIAAAALFVASDDASFMTGADMIVDGGYTAV